MKQKPASSTEGGFPLAAVVLLVTTAAALLACIDMPRIREGLEDFRMTRGMIVAIVLAILAGVGVGALLGLMRRRRLGGLFLGGSVGGLTAAAVIPLTLAPASVWQCLVGMGLLLLTSVAVRWNAR
jgi:hypothetical protein